VKTIAGWLWLLLACVSVILYTVSKVLCNKKKGGETVSTGVVEAEAAYRGSYRLVKKVGQYIIADDYNYALAA
jgi:hypothetical protein